MNVADNSQMVCEAVAAVDGVEVSNLCIVVELEQERDLRVLGILPDDNAILVVIVFVMLLRPMLAVLTEGYGFLRSSPALGIRIIAIGAPALTPC